MADSHSFWSPSFAVDEKQFAPLPPLTPINMTPRKDYQPQGREIVFRDLISPVCYKSLSQGITSITFYAGCVLKALFVGRTDYENDHEHMAQSGFVHT